MPLILFFERPADQRHLHSFPTRRSSDLVKHAFAVARSSSRVKRIYLYHWNADPRFLTWDSAFVAANGRARPALDVLRQEVNRTRKGRPQLRPLARFPRKTLPLF